MVKEETDVGEMSLLRKGVLFHILNLEDAEMNPTPEEKCEVHEWETKERKSQGDWESECKKCGVFMISDYDPHSPSHKEKCSHEWAIGHKDLPYCVKCGIEKPSPSPEARVEGDLNINGLFILCDKCTKPLKEQGGLIFSPPDKFHQLKKYHICVNCWEELKAWSLSQVVANEARVDWAKSEARDIMKKFGHRADAAYSIEADLWLFNRITKALSAAFEKGRKDTTRDGMMV